MTCDSLSASSDSRATGPEPRAVARLGHTGRVDALATLDVGESAIVLRRAEAGDLPAIVGLLAADQLGAARDGVRDDAGLQAYRRAFAAIDRDPAHVLVVAQAGDRVVATMQLSFLPGLARRGSLRAQIEAVRVHEDFRS
jgi:hypothetical protein